MNQRPLSPFSAETAHRLRRLNSGLQIAFLAVALMLVWWGIVQGGWLAARSDNPRGVEAALRLRRGPITDANGIPLAFSEGEERVQRRYHPAAGAAVGYYSFRHGTAGIEQSLDAHLRGEREPFWLSVQRELLHQPRAGLGVRLTLDAAWQTTATEALAGQKGALLLLTLPDRGIRALVSAPGYNPDLLDSQFEQLRQAADAPLLNRVTQGSYQPGLMLYPFVLGKLQDETGVRLDSDVREVLGDVPAGTAIMVGETRLGCAVPLAGSRWEDVLRAVCPAPLQAVGGTLSADTVTSLLNAFRFDTLPDLPIPQAAPATTPARDATLALLGQENLTVTPLQVGRAWAALAQGGEMGQLQLVAALQNEAGQWQSQPVNGERVRVLSAETARRIVAALPRHGSLIEYSAPALTGPDQQNNQWYLGLAPADNPRYALVLVLEGESADNARQIGRSLLESVLAGRE